MSQITMRQIVCSVAAKHGLRRADMIGQSRAKLVSYARHEAMYEMCRQQRWSLPQMGVSLNVTHWSVIYGIKAHAARHGLPEWPHKSAIAIVPAKERLPAKTLTHCARGHAFTADNLDLYKFLVRGRRECRTCARARYREWSARQRRDGAAVLHGHNNHAQGIS